ncbi:MAG: dihydroorotate dehydrogenase [Candidatus Omnitrophota bacterium]
MQKTSLSVKIGQLRLENPIMVASGTFGYAKEFKGLTNLKKLGAIITKTITIKPRTGNLQQRLVETSSGIINSIGLQNDGIDCFLKDKLPFLKTLGVPIIVSIAGNNLEDYVKLAEIINDVEEISAVELNLSCPNIKEKQTLISQDESLTYDCVFGVRNVYKKTLIAKLTPNVTDVTQIAIAAQDAGADSVSLINTFLAMGVNIETQKPLLGNITGGLSGPAIKPIALRMVWQVSQKIKIPVIGVGGIMNYSDALEFIIAGAQAIQVGTANFVNPNITGEIIDEIKNYLRNKKINDINNLVGSLKI